MSKGLIDLSRANTPPENPLKSTPAIADKPKKEVVAPATANSNEPPAQAAVEVSSPVMTSAPVPTPAVQTAERVSTIGARIPESLHQTIKLFCIANRIEMQVFVQDALTNHLETLQSKRTS